MPISVALRVPHRLANGQADQLAAFVQRVERSDIDAITVGDHVSFHDGTGYDGIVQAAALAAMSRRLDIWTAVYLLALRHPVAVARQVASLAALAPGRFVFGVGLGGDDPHELEVCGVDPRRRGARLDACLDTVRGLLAGETVTVDSAHFVIPSAVIRPVPRPSVPIIVGGRSEAALRRAGRVGDGWLSVWHSPARVANSIEIVEASAREHGRGGLARRYGYAVWCGLDPDRDTARRLVGDEMEGLYRRPFSSFERYTPYGTPADVAASLAPYVEAGVQDLVIIGVGDDDALVDAVDEIRAALRSST
jgi:alkanesulfonate monooxygenase SsuD/methylene tetrahydromethanopterin reductase-like flavin-dependent oxidoreductase (luciferase family)